VVVAVLVSMVAVPVGLWAGLVAAATIIGQVLAGFGVLANADWMQVLNPAVWLGIQNVAGNGSVLDSLVGGPGAPGGTVNRYVAFMVTGVLAAACYTALRAVWSWASRPPVHGSVDQT
jgi:hypothetical protein